MKIAVLATDELYNELTGQKNEVEWIKVDNWQDFIAIQNVAAHFNLLGNAAEENYLQFTTPVFIHAACTTLQEIHAPVNICRLLAWPSFLQRGIWEVAGNISERHRAVLHTITKNYVQVADEPGMVSGKIISMIINEAYFALEDNVSTKEEIDIAMKLGTNYPYGPLEWAAKIGLKNIYAVLQKLSLTDKRYAPSLLLTAAATT
jgi:3-hydroxybutyryl-CoA dehydrogenase